MGCLVVGLHRGPIVYRPPWGSACPLDACSRLHVAAEAVESLCLPRAMRGNAHDHPVPRSQHPGLMTLLTSSCPTCSLQAPQRAEPAVLALRKVHAHLLGVPRRAPGPPPREYLNQSCLLSLSYFGVVVLCMLTFSEFPAGPQGRPHVSGCACVHGKRRCRYALPGCLGTHCPSCLFDFAYKLFIVAAAFAWTERPLLGLGFDVRGIACSWQLPLPRACCFCTSQQLASLLPMLNAVSGARVGDSHGQAAAHV